MINQSILIVDDDTYLALTLQYTLNCLCPESSIIVARNGLEALTYIEKLPIDLLLTDYEMPEMNGLALAATVRQRRPKTRIILITGHPLTVDLQAKISKLNLDGYIRKPYTLNEILALLPVEPGDNVMALV